MALLTLEGIYKEGRLEFTEADIQVPAEARVLVTFLPAPLLRSPWIHGGAGTWKKGKRFASRHLRRWRQESLWEDLPIRSARSSMAGASGSGRALADTNVVVYAYDPADAVKHQVAKDLLQQLSDSGRLVFSTQVLNEFCSVMMRPSSPVPLTAAQAAVAIRRLAATGEVVPITAATTCWRWMPCPGTRSPSGTR